MSAQAIPQVGILVLAESSASVVYGMYDLFCSAGRDWGLIVEGAPGPSVVEVTTVAKRSGRVAVLNGVSVDVAEALSESRVFDVVCVAELAVVPGEPMQGRFSEETTWLRRQHEAGAIIATACSGSLLLAEAGMLDGFEATTHWAYCETLSESYPNIKVHPERSLVITGEGQRLVMAGGGTSWLDLALYLIARLVGQESAMQVARLNLIDWHAIGQQPYAHLARTKQVDDPIIAQCQEWIAKRPNVEAPVASMVRLSGLPERTFKRRFQSALGMTPLSYVHTLRLEEAKRLLETTDERLEQIAEKVGYEDAAFFSRLFKRSVHLSPAQYRRRFGSLRSALLAHEQ